MRAGLPADLGRPEVSRLIAAVRELVVPRANFDLFAAADLLQLSADLAYLTDRSGELIVLLDEQLDRRNVSLPEVLHRPLPCRAPAAARRHGRLRNVHAVAPEQVVGD